MYKSMRNAFTMVELMFVIVIIGILSAIAVPKFQSTAEVAHDAKGANILAIVRSSIATERQKQILKGKFDAISDLGDETYVFKTFKPSGNEVTPYPVKSGTDKGDWERKDATHYRYHFADGSGTADYVLSDNKLKCDNDETDCNKLLQ